VSHHVSRISLLANHSPLDTETSQVVLELFGRLEDDPKLDGKFRFNGQDIEIFVNDRLVAPNNASTRDALDSDLLLFCRKLFRGTEYTLSFGSDPRSLFAAYVKAKRSFSVAELQEALS
jgi:hypothetical protein